MIEERWAKTDYGLIKEYRVTEKDRIISEWKPFDMDWKPMTFSHSLLSYEGIKLVNKMAGM